MSDLIDRQDAIDAPVKMVCEGLDWIPVYHINGLPSAQHEPSEITDEQAIMHLQSTGWMQNHDREMYESGLRERLADDSDSYDALLPSAQHEEDCDTCKHGYFGDDQCNNCRVRYPSHYERRTDE